MVGRVITVNNTIRSL